MLVSPEEMGCALFYPRLSVSDLLERASFISWKILEAFRCGLTHTLVSISQSLCRSSKRFPIFLLTHSHFSKVIPTSLVYSTSLHCLLSVFRDPCWALGIQWRKSKLVCWDEGKETEVNTEIYGDTQCKLWRPKDRNPHSALVAKEGLPRGDPKYSFKRLAGNGQGWGTGEPLSRGEGIPHRSNNIFLASQRALCLLEAMPSLSHWASMRVSFTFHIL